MNKINVLISKLQQLLILFLCIIMGGCGVYSFSQGAIPPEVKTISIDYFNNESGNGPPTLGQVFTEKLRGYYQQNSRLGIVKSNGDWHLEGRIVGWNFIPIAPAEDQTSNLNRLTISVQVKFVNYVDEKASFTENFSWYADAPRDASPTAIEGQLVEEITDKIIFNIFNKTTSNW